MDQTPPSQNPPRRRLPGMLSWVLIGLAGLFAAGLVLLPYGVKWYLEGWLLDRGVVNVDIGDVDINPFTGAFAIQSLEFEDETGQHRAGHAALNLNWTDLVNRRIRLSRVEVRDAELKIRRTESEGWVIGTIVVSAQEAVEEAERTEVESGWGFGIDQLSLEDIAIDFRDPLIVRNFVVDEASLSDFATWLPDQATGLTLALSAGEERLSASGDGRPFADTAALDLQIEGENLNTDGLDVLLQSAGVESVSGELDTRFRIKVLVPPAGTDTSITVEGSLGFDDLEISLPPDRFAADGLAWDGSIEMSFGPMDQRVDTDGQLSVETGAADVIGAGINVALEQFDWRGKLAHEGSEGANTLTVSGDLQVAGLNTEVVEAAAEAGESPAATVARLASLQIETDELNLTTSADRSDTGWQGKLRIQELGLDAPPAQLNLESLDWEGSVTAAAAEEDEMSVLLDGALNAGGLGFNDAISTIEAMLDSLEWKGRAQIAETDGWSVDAGGELIARQLGAAYRGQDRKLLNVSTLRAVLADAGPDDILSLAGLEITELDLLGRPSAEDEPGEVVSIAGIDVDGLGVGSDSLTFGEVILSDAQVWLERARDGSFEPGVLSAAPGSQASQEGGDNAESAPDKTAGQDDQSTRFSLAGLKTAGDSRLVYVDHTVRPVGRLEFSALELELGAVDAARPDEDTPVSITASRGRFGKFTFEGRLRPLAKQNFVSGQGAITDINMIRLDGYARRAIGYAIKSGTLSADLRVDLQDQRLDSEADLTIRKLDLEALKPDQQDEFSTELGVPLETALGLLEDDQETIRLKVPLKGDLDDLSVGVGDAVRLVMKKGLMAGMKSAATSYFAPLWPALAASKLFAAASKLSFRAVTFAPGADELGAEQDAYLQQMALLLEKRPKVSLTLCGRAVAADRAVLYPDAGDELDDEQRAAMAELSERRHDAVKDRLIGAGIGSARLVTCAPEASPDDAGAPRVDFGV